MGPSRISGWSFCRKPFIVGADVVVPYGYPSSPHWPNAHSMYVFAREPTETHIALTRTSKVRAWISRICIGRRCKIQAKRRKFWLVRLDDSNRAHTVEDEAPPLAVQSAEVGPNRCAGVPATARSGVRKKTDGACPSSRKMATAEPDGIFRQKPFEDYVT